MKTSGTQTRQTQTRRFCWLLVISSLLHLASLGLAYAEEASQTMAAPTETSLMPVAKPVRKETERSRRLQQQLHTTDLETEAIWLGSGEDEFLGLYRADSSGAPFASIVILHDNLQHPDWPGIVRQMRLKLAENGWNTLSIALPDYVHHVTLPPLEPPQAAPLDTDIEAEATEPPDMMPSANPEGSADALNDTPDDADTDTEPSVEYTADEIPGVIGNRTKLAIEFLKEKAPLPVIIVCHGFSATVAAKEAQSMLLENIAGLVLIDPVEVPFEGFNINVDAMDLRIPILDITPEFNPRTPPSIRLNSAKRLQHQQYRQKVVRGSPQDFSGFESIVVRTLRGWGESRFKSPAY